MYTLTTMEVRDNLKIDYIILYSGGNEESITDTLIRRKQLLQFFQNLTKGNKNIAVVSYNYPLMGYAPGESEYSFRIIERLTDFIKQKPILGIVHNAILSIFDKILVDFPNPKTKIIPWGRSIGSLPTGYLLHEKHKDYNKKIFFSIIESGIASIIQAKFPSITLPFLVKDSNIYYATKDRDWGSVVFILGSIDKVVNPENNMILSDALD